MKTTSGQVLALAVYCLAGVIAGVLVYNTLAVPVHGSTHDYVLEFADVEGLDVGNPVTLAGVRVGRVDTVEVVDGPDGTARAHVTVEVRRDQELSERVTAAVRYGDMLGARYVALTDPSPRLGAPGDAGTLPPGSVVPIDRTTPPVDLTALMNGFRPLFDALDPDEVNALTRNIVDTFNGRPDAVVRFLDRVAELSTRLADREDLFAEVVTNMSTLLGTVDDRSEELRTMLQGLAAIGDSVVGDGERLGALVDHGAAAVDDLARMIEGSNGAFTRTVAELDSVTRAWNGTTPEFEQMVGALPGFADRIGRTGRYGSFVSLYMCNFTMKAGDAEVNIFGPTHSPVCS